MKRLGPVLSRAEGSSVGSFRKHALNGGDQPKKCSTASETYQNGSRTVRNKFLTPPGGLLVAGFYFFFSPSPGITPKTEKSDLGAHSGGIFERFEFRSRELHVAYK